MIALQQEFGKDIPFIGCEFHWKKAIRIKLIVSCRLPVDDITKIIGENSYGNTIVLSLLMK